MHGRWRASVLTGKCRSAPSSAISSRDPQKLIVEVDGGQHSWQGDEDAERTRYLEGLGFTVPRFWNNDVLERTEGVVEAIASVLARLPSPGPSRERKGNP